jgi:hypothetical protein
MKKLILIMAVLTIAFWAETKTIHYPETKKEKR